MQIRKSVGEDGGVVLRLDGELDTASAPTVEPHLRALTSTPGQRIVLDVGGVSFMSSAGVRLLQVALRTSRANGGEIALAAVGPPIQRVLEQTGMLPLFRLVSGDDARTDSRPAESENRVSSVAHAESLPALEQHISAVLVRGADRATLDFRRSPYMAHRAIRQYVRDTAEAQGASAAAVEETLLAVDEAISNIVHHGYRGRQEGRIEITVERDGADLVIRLYDDAPPFDPTTVEPPDLTLPLEQRPVGGLGIHLMRQNMDRISHGVTEQGGNELTLVKRGAIQA